MRGFFVTLFFLIASAAHTQTVVKSVVVDSVSRQPLPFVTIQTPEKTIIGTIDGRFSLNVQPDAVIKFSYSGHRPKWIAASTLLTNDTVLLAPLAATMEEVVVRSQSDKVRRIVNAVVRNRSLHNPDNYNAYECNIYYKMIVDIEAYGAYNRDSIRRRQDSISTAWRLRRGRDTAARKLPFAVPSHLFVTETYSKRLYKKPAQTQEIVLASKFSGLSQTYFANIVTAVLPFHVYSDYIPLNGIDFVNPLIKGWQSRYRFLLEDELAVEGDTVFVLSYRPNSNASFNSLSGLVYVTSRNFAVTHFTGSNNANDSSGKRLVKFEHIYRRLNGRWFPQELNYDFGIPRMPEVYTQVVWNGRSVIDSVRFDAPPSVKFDKAHPLKLSDSVDLRSDEDWSRFRRDSLSIEEKNTYRNLDSLAKTTPMESFILLGARVATGRFPVGAFDLDVRRIITANRYEGTRLGLGLYTNNRISKYFSLGGWWGYGFRDKVAKHGASLTVFPKGDKETWLLASYQKAYRLTGEVSLHPELTKTALRNWLLQQVDEIKEYAVTLNFKPGYWELRPSVVRTEVGPLHYFFQADGKTVTNFVTNEAGLGLRYAYGEKRVPFFDYYLPSGTKYPVVYGALSRGRMIAGSGPQASYTRALAAVTFSKRFNRWGADRFRLEGGLVVADDRQPLPRSLLLAANGFNRNGINFYSFGGFLTVRPFDYYSDRYAALLYKHDFDKNLWDLKWSKPFISLAHNAVYGNLRTESKSANPGLRNFSAGYHESGLLINRLLRYNLGFADAALNVGPFYRWQKGGSWKEAAVWVVGLSTGF